MKIKFRKEAKIIVKEVPEAFGGPYVPEQRRRDLRGFAMSDESLEAIERLRRQRRKEAEELWAAFGFGKEKQWWEDY